MLSQVRTSSKHIFFKLNFSPRSNMNVGSIGGGSSTKCCVTCDTCENDIFNSFLIAHNDTLYVLSASLEKQERSSSVLP